MTGSLLSIAGASRAPPQRWRSMLAAVLVENPEHLGLIYPGYAAGSAVPASCAFMGRRRLRCCVHMIRVPEEEEMKGERKCEDRVSRHIICVGCLAA